MTRPQVIAVLVVLTTLAVVHAYLWLKGMRPSRRTTLWQYATSGLFPRDDQTKRYIRIKTLALLIVMPTVLVVVNILFYVYDSLVR